MTKADLSNEWMLLQNQYDSYEKYSLMIKLVAMVVFYFAHISEKIGWIVLILLAIFWLQDAIWKTFQSRIELRLLAVEEALSDKEPSTQKDGNNNFIAYQFNTDFLSKRPSQIGLIKEYFMQALRPTVAFPYCVLIALLIVGVI
tara:strand:+ start:647 stop:1078 length:432 start_codon:yes stop_codon:yes gene_type:complete